MSNISKGGSHSSFSLLVIILFTVVIDMMCIN